MSDYITLHAVMESRAVTQGRSGPARGRGTRQRLMPHQGIKRKLDHNTLGKFAMGMHRSGRFSTADVGECSKAASDPDLRELGAAVDSGARVQ
jgi:hypothetical protein